MTNLTQAVLTAALAEATGLPAIHAKTGVKAVIDTMETSLRKTGTFVLPGFGTFTIKRREAHVGRNPRTGEPVKIGVKRTVHFKASGTLKAEMTAARAPAA